MSCSPIMAWPKAQLLKLQGLQLPCMIEREIEPFPLGWQSQLLVLLPEGLSGPSAGGNMRAVLLGKPC